MPRVLVTGSSGLVGRALVSALVGRGYEVRRFDLREAPPAFGDVRVRDEVDRAMDGCTGVVHLAAVSRVIFAERDPAACRVTNIEGTRNVIDAACDHGVRWLLFASSREVYGQPDSLPCPDDAPLQPINVYGHAKVAGENMTMAARARGLRTAVLRLSNVYGCIRDHTDRVVPAFVRGALEGRDLRVDGHAHTFDFTHIDDTTRGLVAAAMHLDGDGPLLPAMHLLTGRPTTLGELARLAVAVAGEFRLGDPSQLVAAPERDFDVARFFGDPSLARERLNFDAQVDLEDGIRALMSDYRDAGSARSDFNSAS